MIIILIIIIITIITIFHQGSPTRLGSLQCSAKNNKNQKLHKSTGI